MEQGDDRHRERSLFAEVGYKVESFWGVMAFGGYLVSFVLSDM